jgi:hypothetical protein
VSYLSEAEKTFPRNYIYDTGKKFKKGRKKNMCICASIPALNLM